MTICDVNWVKVEDNLPPLKEKVFVRVRSAEWCKQDYLKYAGGYCYATRELCLMHGNNYNNYEWYTDSDRLYGQEVTHWTKFEIPLDLVTIEVPKVSEELINREWNEAFSFGYNIDVENFDISSVIELSKLKDYYTKHNKNFGELLQRGYINKALREKKQERESTERAIFYSKFLGGVSRCTYYDQFKKVSDS